MAWSAVMFLLDQCETSERCTRSRARIYVNNDMPLALKRQAGQHFKTLQVANSRTCAGYGLKVRANKGVSGIALAAFHWMRIQ
jgi:hypothetical protein